MNIEDLMDPDWKNSRTEKLPKYRPGRKDPIVAQIVTTLATKHNVTEEQVWGAISNHCNWQWRSFHKAEYAEYYWPRFGTFRWFNRNDDDPRFKEGMDDYLKGKAVKDKNRLSKEERGGGIDIPESHRDFIRAIEAFDPSSLKNFPKKIKNAWKKYGWSVGGSDPKGGWNLRTLVEAKPEELETLLNLLEQHGKKIRSTEED